jgi:hypothetical protein
MNFFCMYDFQADKMLCAALLVKCFSLDYDNVLFFYENAIVFIAVAILPVLQRGGDTSPLRTDAACISVNQSLQRATFRK